MKKLDFINFFVEEIEAGNAAIFAGAGLSVPAGFVNWRDLLRGIAADIGLDVSKEHDLVGVAQYHVNENGQQRGKLNQAILNSLSAAGGPTGSHLRLAQLPIDVWWTTNYDKLIEQALESEGKIADVKYTVSQLAHTRPKRDAVVYKMHGDISDPANAVITRDDYEKYSKNRGAFVNALSGDLVSRTFLFLGFGFSDPNLANVLALVRAQFENNIRPHYAIFKKESRSDYPSEEEYNYAVLKQNFFIKDLLRFNINAVLIDRYEEIFDIINEIYKSYKSRRIFISSSVADFAPWGESEVKRFLQKLGQVLIQQGFRVVSGYGLGSGDPLISGAIQEILVKGLKIGDEILLRPFPQSIDSQIDREKIWKSYREDMIQRCGVAMFIFGNKESAAGIVPATGMISEFEIARDMGLTLIPVASTGSAARQISDMDFFNNYEINIDGLRVECTDLMNLIGPIIDVLHQARLRS